MNRTLVLLPAFIGALLMRCAPPADPIQQAEPAIRDGRWASDPNPLPDQTVRSGGKMTLCKLGPVPLSDPAG